MNTSTQKTKEQNTRTMNGIDKHFAGVKSVTLGGAPYTPVKLKAVFQANNDAITASDDAHVELKQLVRARKASDKATARVRRLLRSHLIAAYGPEALAILADFGFATPRDARSVETKALAVVKMRATRKARHTAGKKARLRIKGEVSPPAPSPTPVPAPNGSPAPSK
jgi:hypothetical protein